MISVSRVVKSYGSGASQVRALDDVTLSVDLRVLRHAVPPTMVPSGSPVFALFRVVYAPATPP